MSARELLALDASVVVELVIAGEHRSGADALLDRYRSPAPPTLVTAAHGLVEAAGALRRLTHRGELSADDGRRAVGWLADLDVVLDPASPRLRRIWELRDRMSAYDAAYAAAAEALDTPLISTDSRLLAACGDAGIPAIHLASVEAQDVDG